MSQSVNEQIGTITAVEAKFHLCQVGSKVLCADLVPAPDDTALQQRECVFYCVRVNIGSESDILFRGVIINVR